MQSIAIYYRVSTDHQDLHSQKQAISDWLKALPENERPQRVQTFEDQGQSGNNLQRKEYQRMLKGAYARQFDTIVVYRLDRISRNAREAIHTLLSLDELGVAFISVSQPVLNLGPQNPFRRTMLAAFAELAEIERVTIVERVRSGLDAAKKRGVQLGAPKKWTPQAEEDVHRLRAQGLSFRKIAEQLGLGYGTVQKIAQSFHPNSENELI